MDVYEKFREKIDSMPIPSPSTESRVEIEILRRLLEPQEAELACNLSAQPEPVNVISKRVGIEEGTLIPLLDSLVKKGVIFKVYSVEPLYSLAAMLPGIYEFQVNRLTPDMVELFEKYYAEKQGEAIFSNKTPFTRVIPVKESIPTEMNVHTYEEVETLIDKASSVTLANCICRSSKKMIGEGCDHPVDEICILLDPWADYYAENNMGRRVTKEEGKKALRRAEEAGLVHNSLNVRDGSFFICNCCGCCCALLRGITQLEIPTAVAKSNLIAQISEADCIGCGECVDRCQVKALELMDSVSTLKEERCIGCGVCVSGCPEDAISMNRREEEMIPPDEFNRLMMQLGEGRA